MTKISSQKTIWLNQFIERLEASTHAPQLFGVALATLFFLRWTEFQDSEFEAAANLKDCDKHLPVLPTEYRWRTLCTLAPIDLLLRVRGLGHFCDIELQKNRPTSREVERFISISPSINSLSEFKHDELALLFEWVNNQPFEKPSDRLVLRDILDDVISKSPGKVSDKLSTPSSIAWFIANLAAPKPGESVYDPCFGTGGLLTAALDYVRRSNVQNTHSTTPLLKVFGGEIDLTWYLLGLSRLVLTDCFDPKLEFGDSLDHAPALGRNDGGYDLIVANPPFGDRISRSDQDDFTIPSTDPANLFIQHAISQLRPDGRAIIVVPQGTLFRGGADRKLRELLLNENRIDQIISFPPSAFLPHASIATSILVLRKGGKTKSVRMVDAASIFSKLAGKGLVTISQENARELCKKILAKEPGLDSIWDVDANSIAAADYNLTATRRDSSELPFILKSMPKDVEVVRLGLICEIISGCRLSRNDFTDKPPESNLIPSGETLFPEIELAEIHPQLPLGFADVPVLVIRGTDVEEMIIEKGSSWLMPAMASRIDSKWMLRLGDVLVPRISRRAKAGIVGKGAVGALAADSLYVLRIDGNFVDPLFVTAYLRSIEVNAWLDDHSSSMAGARRLTARLLSSLPFPIPSIRMQQLAVERHRKFGTDILSCISDLAAGNKNDPLSEKLNAWVNNFESRIGSITSATEASAMLNELEWIADSNPVVDRCDECGEPYFLDFESPELNAPVNYAAGINKFCLPCWLEAGPGNESVESLRERSDLVPWALAFRESVLPFKGISSIPDKVGVMNILQTACMKIELTLGQLDKLSNPKQQHAATSLTRNVSKILSSIYANFCADIDLVTKVNRAIQLTNGEIEIVLEVQNCGSVPIRDAEFAIKPQIPAIESTSICYLSPGETFRVGFRGIDKRTNKANSFVLTWKGRNLAHEMFHGSREVPFELAEKAIDEVRPKEQYPDLGASPYVCGDPVKADREDVFFGRQDLLDQIRRQISHSGNVVLLEGNRRAGKSSILWHLEGIDAVPGWLGVYCSLQGAKGEMEGGIPTAEVFRHIAYEIAQAVRKLNGQVKLPNGTVLDANTRLGIARSIREGISEESPFHDFREYVEQILKDLEARGLGLLIMLDEFDKLQEGIENKITSPQVPENIRFLIQSSPKVSAILTGSRRLKRMRQEYWSALFGLGTRKGVTELPIEAASRLITEPVKGRLFYANDAVTLAMNLTARQPYLLQCLCNRVFDIASQTGIRSITIDQLKEAAKALVEDNEHFASLWDYSGNDRRRFILFLLHREGKGSAPIRLGSLRAKLEEYQIAIKENVLMHDLEFLQELELVSLHGESTGAYYTLTVPMMGDWLEVQQDFQVLQKRAGAEADELIPVITQSRNLRDEIKRLEQAAQEQVDIYEDPRIAEYEAELEFAEQEQDWFDENVSRYEAKSYEALKEGMSEQETLEEEIESYLSQFDDPDEAEYERILLEREIEDDEMIMRYEKGEEEYEAQAEEYESEYRRQAEELMYEEIDRSQQEELLESHSMFESEPDDPNIENDDEQDEIPY